MNSKKKEGTEWNGWYRESTLVFGNKATATTTTNKYRVATQNKTFDKDDYDDEEH